MAIYPPKGNTQLGVTKKIYEWLGPALMQDPQLVYLDMPCGEGDFIRFLKKHHPELQAHGVEVTSFPTHAAMSSIRLHYTDLSKPIELKEQFHVITCISGVMEFENTGLFLQSCWQHLRPGGHFFVTNDNVMTIRDRLSFLFFGKVKRFQLSMVPGTPTYKYLSIQELHRILLQTGFKIETIAYTSLRKEDLLMAPLAAFIYIFQWLFLRFEKTAMPWQRRLQLFPFQALLCRHYVIHARRPVP